MALINKIEQRILEMDGGEFQKLCDAYLSRVGFGKPNSTGGIAGTNKVRKGTPDTFFDRPNGSFVFAEYTTQKDNLLKKLQSDLKKCLDEKKTKVSVSKIDEIVMCYTGQLEPAEILLLKSQSQGIKLNLMGISAIATDLLNHPFLVRNFLGLEIDTGQIIPLESFPAVYSKSKFATTLETHFHFREKEIEDLSNALDTCDLIVVSGKAGVGKTRFALEGCRNFATQHSEYQVYSVVSRSQNLYEDLQEQFSQPGQFLILVDDANRVIDFSYFMYILRNQKDIQHFKIIVTVRDYALDKIENDISTYPYQSIQLDRLTDDQIKAFIKDEYNLNSLALERIVDISGGNPRIAMMISKVALEKNTFQSINDVSALYDEYFSSIKEDLQNFGEADLLKTAGIIAFLRAVDRANDQMMSGIQESFHISPDTFWNCAFRLHELEMVDMYENEVVRISDQVLSTYLFYLAYFKEKVLDFSDILQNYFSGSKSKIVDALNPVLTAFDQNAILDSIRPKVQILWEDLATLNDDEKLLALAELFWHLLPTPTLTLITRRLSQTQFAPADLSQLDQIDENKLRNVSLITELRLLGYFRYTTPDLWNVALELLLGYLDARPIELMQVLHILVEDYGFDRFINQTGSSIQQKVVDLLWNRAENGRNELYSRLFISVAREYLKTNFESNEMRSKRIFVMRKFTLPPTPEIFQLRTITLNHLFELYKFFPQQIVSIFENYVHGYYEFSSNEIFSNDSISLMRFIDANLTPDNYNHIIFVNDYLDFLENHGITFDVEIRKKFQSEAFSIYQLLSENRKDFTQYGYEEYQLIKKANFISHFANFSELDVKHFIDVCIELGNDIKRDKDRHEVISGFKMGMEILVGTRQDLSDLAVSYYLQQGDKLNLYPVFFIRNFLLKHSKDETFNFFDRLEYPTKKKWLFGYYQILPPDIIDANDLTQLYRLVEEAEISELSVHPDFLLNYKSLDHRVVAKVAQLILDKGSQEYPAGILGLVLNPYSDINKHLVDLFKDDIQTLEKIYLTVKASRDHYDHESITFSKILEIDPEFIVEYIEWIYTPKGEDAHWHHDDQDYSELWHHQNYKEIFKRIIDLAYKKVANPYWYPNLKQFFGRAYQEEHLDVEIEQKQEELLAELIKVNSQNAKFIEFLFEVIAYFPKERRSRLIFIFLQQNKNFSDFEKLEIEPGMMSWSGSAVPVYQERIGFLKSLLPLLNTAQLLEHRKYIEQRINSLEKQLMIEKKHDFIGEEDF